MTEKQWPNSKKPSDSPPRTVFHLLQVLNWATPSIERTAKLGLVLRVLDIVLLALLLLLVATN